MAARKLKRSEQLPDTSGWELLVRLAQGGMGAVFLGTRRGTREPIYAIKRAHAHLLEETEFRKMFTAEAQLALKIQHPHAIGVRAVDETDGELLLIMDYFEGSSFGELLTAAHESGNKLPPGVVLRIVLDAARGLDAAHRLTDERGQPLGIVHRDISPQNILVGINGMGAIVDFGVAKAVAVESTRTATEVLKGKTAYMAPEYLKSRVANPQTDVFSLGVVAWEALANRRLFKREDEVATMQAIVSAEPAQMLVDLMPFDATLSAIIARSLVKEPRQRFLSAREFADALEARATATELLATRGEVAAAMKRLLGEGLEERRALVEDALSQRFGMRDVSASARVTNIIPTAQGSDAATVDQRDSNPFQIMDTPRRRAITVPQERRAEPQRPFVPRFPLSVGAQPVPSMTVQIEPQSMTVPREAQVAPQSMTVPQLAPQSMTVPREVQGAPQSMTVPREVQAPQSLTVPRSPPVALIAPRETMPMRTAANVSPVDVRAPLQSMPEVPSTQSTFVGTTPPASMPAARPSSKLGWAIGGGALVAVALGAAAFGLVGAERVGATPGAKSEATAREEGTPPVKDAPSQMEVAPTPSGAVVASAVELPVALPTSSDQTAQPVAAPPAGSSARPSAPPRDAPKVTPKPTNTGWRPKSNPYN
jgi:serine/threonine protein kinase